MSLGPFASHPTVCSIEGCSRKHYARGWCKLHYRRWYHHGDPLVVLNNYGKSLAERFWLKVDKNGPLPQHRSNLGNCWLWIAFVEPGGYGIMRIAGKNVTAHRVAHELFIGPVADELYVDHLCRNKCCVNPAHLEAVTPRENTLRGIGPSALNAAKTHCKHGHPFDAENTFIKRDGSRLCRECHRRARRRYLARHREMAA